MIAFRPPWSCLPLLAEEVDSEGVWGSLALETCVEVSLLKMTSRRRVQPLGKGPHSTAKRTCRADVAVRPRTVLPFLLPIPHSCRPSF